VEQFLHACGKCKREDAVATATALTAKSIAGAIHELLPSTFGENAFLDMIVSGGGSKNCTLLKMLREELPELQIKTSDSYGVPAEAKEAVAFAVLAYQTWHKTASSIPSATGADYPAVLGKVSYP
jgi:anhydro-N-acetylmuramic acid kinase